MKFPQRYSLGTYLHGSIAFLNRYDVMTAEDMKTEAKRSFFYCCDYIASAATTKFFK